MRQDSIEPGDDWIAQVPPWDAFLLVILPAAWPLSTNSGRALKLTIQHFIRELLSDQQHA